VKVNDFFSKCGTRVLSTVQLFTFVTDTDIAVDDVRQAFDALLEAAEDNDDVSEEAKVDEAVFMRAYLPRTLMEVSNPYREAQIIAEGGREKEYVEAVQKLLGAHGTSYTERNFLHTTQQHPQDEDKKAAEVGIDDERGKAEDVENADEDECDDDDENEDENENEDEVDEVEENEGDEEADGETRYRRRLPVDAEEREREKEARKAAKKAMKEAKAEKRKTKMKKHLKKRQLKKTTSKKAR
jgi:RIO kinase 1